MNTLSKKKKNNIYRTLNPVPGNMPTIFTNIISQLLTHHFDKFLKCFYAFEMRLISNLSEVIY